MNKHIIIVSPSSRLRKSLRVLLKSFNSEYEFEEKDLIENLDTMLSQYPQIRVLLDANLLEEKPQKFLAPNRSQIIVLAHTNEQCLMAQQNNYRNILFEEMTPELIERLIN